MHVKHSKTANENTTISAISFVICLHACIPSFFTLLKKYSEFFLKKTPPPPPKPTPPKTPKHKVRIIWILCSCCYVFYINKTLLQSLCCIVGQKHLRMSLAALICLQPYAIIYKVAVYNGIKVTDVSHS